MHLPISLSNKSRSVLYYRRITTWKSAFKKRYYHHLTLSNPTIPNHLTDLILHIPDQKKKSPGLHPQIGEQHVATKLSLWRTTSNPTIICIRGSGANLVGRLLVGFGCSTIILSWDEGDLCPDFLRLEGVIINDKCFCCAGSRVIIKKVKTTLRISHRGFFHQDYTVCRFARLVAMRVSSTPSSYTTLHPQHHRYHEKRRNKKLIGTR